MNNPDTAWSPNSLSVRVEMFRRLSEQAVSVGGSHLANAEQLYVSTVDDFLDLADPGGAP